MAEFVVVEQVMAVVNGQMTPIVGASSILHEDEKLEASATRCVDYEILFDAQPGVTYRVVAVVAPVVGGRRVAEASAPFSLPSQMEAVEIDAKAWVRDGWIISCDNVWGQNLDFTCSGHEAAGPAPGSERGRSRQRVVHGRSAERRHLW